MRTPLVVGNWKMNTLLEDAQRLMHSLVASLDSVSGVEVVVCPPAPWIPDVARLAAGTRVLVGAQNMHYQDGGAFTGEVSPRMLAGLCQYVLVGQYERRILFGEKDGIVKRKVDAALRRGLKPILCVGETADQLEEGVGPYIIAEQVEAALEGLPVDERLTIAYEPSWTTIGMVTPPPQSYVDDMVGQVRDTLTMLFSAAAAEAVRVIYGGSVTPRNMQSLGADPALDGVLTGATSTSAENFAAVVRAFQRDNS